MKSALFLKFPYSSRFGGGEKHTLLVAEELKRRGIEPYFVGSCSVLLHEFRKRRFHALRWWAGKEPVSKWALLVFPFTALFAGFGLAGILLFYRFGKSSRTIFCLSLTEKVLITPFAALLGLRVIWMEHLTFERWLSKNPLLIFYRAWSRWASIIAVSGMVRDQLLELGVPERSITVVYPGVDLKEFEHVHRNSSHWVHKFIIGSVARLEAEKGIPYLLRAFQKLVQVIPQARLIIVGDGSQRRPLEWLCRQLEIEKSVQWVGFQQSASWMHTFDCFVLPSVQRESFGLVLAEALASGCPVIASNLGGIPEVIVPNRTGILVEPADSEMLMEAILYVYQHPDVAMKLGAQGRKYVEERFSLPTILDTILSLFA